jgi:hypothetical protein
MPGWYHSMSPRSLKTERAIRVQTEVAGRKAIQIAVFLANHFPLSSKPAYTSISVSGRTLGPQDERQPQTRSHRKFEGWVGLSWAGERCRPKAKTFFMFGI